MIVDGHHDVVGHHVLNIDRSQSHLSDRAGKPHPGIGIHRKRCILAFGEPADIRLADIRIHLHLREVQRDQKEVRRSKTGGDGLTDFDIPGDDDAIDGRTDGGIFQFQFC